jgi:hypothetical protein
LNHNIPTSWDAVPPKKNRMRALIFVRFLREIRVYKSKNIVVLYNQQVTFKYIFKDLNEFTGNYLRRVLVLDTLNGIKLGIDDEF